MTEILAIMKHIKDVENTLKKQAISTDNIMFDFSNGVETDTIIVTIFGYKSAVPKSIYKDLLQMVIRDSNFNI